MPRDLPVGNGRLLVNFDRHYQLRDIYFPNVGKENQTRGHPCRMGVWVDGQFRWLDDESWRRTLRYLPDTLVTDVHLHHPDLQLNITCHDAVDFSEDVLVRQLVLENLADHPREVRLFLHHDFHILENAVGDTAYYKPDLDALIHYKGPRYFLISGRIGDKHGLDQWTTGVKEAGGREGTWRDAEDGTLGMNPITQGSVDSCMAIHAALGARATATVWAWLAAATSYERVKTLHALVLEKGPDVLLQRTADYWHLWANKEDWDYGSLPVELVRLFKRSLLLIRTNLDEGGGVVAATDADIITFSFDTYSYVWPRDGALVCHALDLAGYPGITRPFFEFCDRVISVEGFFLHKYNADQTLASSWHPWIKDGKESLPIQEDETALVLWALWHHFDTYRDIEFIRPLYRNLITRAGDFLLRYRDERNLPLPSWDLWEERWGVHAFTVGAVYGGLVAAANFARSFGEHERSQQYRRAADQLHAAAEQYLWREELGRFARALYPQADGTVQVDGVIDAALAGLFYFGMYTPNHPRLVATLEQVRQELSVKTPAGGIARYTNDYYHQVSQDVARVPGNPWFICTLWLAQWQIAYAENEEMLEESLGTLRWVQQHALPSGVLAEQVDPMTGAPLSVSPLTWSHAVFVAAIAEYLDCRSRLHTCPTCGRPTYTKEDRRLHYQRAHHHMPSDEAALPGAFSTSQGEG